MENSLCIQASRSHSKIELFPFIYKTIMLSNRSELATLDATCTQVQLAISCFVLRKVVSHQPLCTGAWPVEGQTSFLHSGCIVPRCSW